MHDTDTVNNNSHPTKKELEYILQSGKIISQFS